MCGVTPRDILHPKRIKQAKALVPDILVWLETALQYGFKIPHPLLPLVDDPLQCSQGEVQTTAHGCRIKKHSLEIAYWYRWNKYDPHLPATHTLINMTSTGIHLAVVDDFGNLVRRPDAERGQPCAE